MTGRFVASFLEAGVCHVSERISPCGTLSTLRNYSFNVLKYHILTIFRIN